MKKFLTAILFLMLVTVGYAQCIDVQITPIKGNCYTDNQIKVTAKYILNSDGTYPSICTSGTPPKGRFTAEILGDGVNGMYRMSPNPLPNKNASAEYTFYNLKMGEYKIIVRDEDTGSFVENQSLTTKQ